MNSSTGWLKLVALVAIAAFAPIGCQGAGTINQQQTFLVAKKVFEGEWWYNETLVQVDGDSAQAAGLFPNSKGWLDLGFGVNDTYGATLPRIRFVIDERFLFAYRAYELTVGGSDDARAEDFIGQPLAVWAIQGHVDVRRDFNAGTGETTNLIVEDTLNRKWYERDYIRVDWSQNLVSRFFGVESEAIFNGARPLSIPASADENTSPEFLPKFVRVSEDADYRFRDEWSGADPNTVHYFSIVTREMWVGSNINATAQKRNAFLRIPPKHEYASEISTHQEFDRFGVYRQQGRTYVRGGLDREVLHQFCEQDLDCGYRIEGTGANSVRVPAGATCDTTKHICVGGLTPDRGETDFLTFYRPRHNIYSDSLTAEQCVNDWECDPRKPNGTGKAGSVCDRSARRCTIPLGERPVRPVTYHLNKGFPTHLVRTAFETVAAWNESFMKGVRLSQGRALPELARRTCQDNDPFSFCFCGSPDADANGTCAPKWDAFVKPSDAALANRGNESEYGCYVEGPADILHPTSFNDYKREDAAKFRFIGSECVLKLEVNTCDKDVNAAKEGRCEELGDLRYQFYNMIQQPTPFGGLSGLIQDPRNGEMVSADVNLGMHSVESIGDRAARFFAVLSGETDETTYFNGEDWRGYFANLGRVDRPATASPSGGSGVGNGGGDPRPNQLPGMTASESARVLNRISQLHGREGRSLILSDRIKNLAGTPTEDQFLAAIGPDIQRAIAPSDPDRVNRDVRAMDPATRRAISPFQGMMETINAKRQRDIKLGAMGFCMQDAQDLISSAEEVYYANAFASKGIGAAERSIRGQQYATRGIMLHELGHSVGMRHNFAGSLDRDNFSDGYYRLARELPLPTLEQYDSPMLGGNGDGNTVGAEVVAYQTAFRRVREQRQARGISNTWTSTVMEYGPDDQAQLGRYDDGVMFFNHFNLVEAFNTATPEINPRGLPAGSSLAGLIESDKHTRRVMQYYRGGEACDADSDCPSANGRVNQGIWQRCVNNTRSELAGAQCRADLGDKNCMCSNFDSDFDNYLAQDVVNPRSPPLRTRNPYRFDPDGSAYAVEFTPVKYLFCTDERTSDISWCTRFDEGESFLEVVDEYRQNWSQTYPLTYYRRNRATGPQSGGSLANIIEAVKIYQHLFFRYYYEPTFTQKLGSGGFNDQYLASMEVMNWLAELASMPSSGSYALAEARDSGSASQPFYRFMDEKMNMAGSTVSVPLGMGFPKWSQYQTGQMGFFKMERAGVFFDKYIALLALAIRDWGLSFTLDERYYINFSDLFPVEMSELFGGFILDEPSWFAPRLIANGTEPARVQYINLFRGGSRCGATRDQICRGSNASTFPAPYIDGTSDTILRNWAAIQSLSHFSDIIDTSFLDHLHVFKAGSGEGFRLPEITSDGRNCAYNGTTCAEDKAGYIDYVSERLHQTYRAVVSRPRQSFTAPEEQLGFQLLKRMTARQARVGELRAITNRTPEQQTEYDSTRRRLEGDETFLDLLITYQNAFGIDNYLFN